MVETNSPAASIGASARAGLVFGGQAGLTPCMSQMITNGVFMNQLQPITCSARATH
jgi:hypothetical protein